MTDRRPSTLKEQADQAFAYLQAIAHFTSARALNNWFATTIQRAAARGELSSDQLERLTHTRDERLRGLR